MQDVETESLWVHLTGTCMEGEHKGKVLDVVPSTITSWNAWKQEHPNTDATVMSRTIAGYTTERYKDGRDYSVGLVIADSAKAWRFDSLMHQPLVNDQLGKTPLVIWYENGSARGYDRTLDNEPLEFENRSGEVFDTRTGSKWDLRKGLAIEGKLTGTRLRMLPMLITLSDAWNGFHDQSQWWPNKDGILPIQLK